jgi:GNAT superfamily N-acetyltransferase
MREMREPDMKYVLVREMGREEEGVVGFMSFMPTHEDGFRVLYLYEIHLAGAAQGYVFFFPPYESCSNLVRVLKFGISFKDSVSFSGFCNRVCLSWRLAHSFLGLLVIVSFPLSSQTPLSAQMLKHDRSGLGKHLMTLLEEVAKRMPATQKTMLTVFRSNVRALAFYEKIGYVTDEYSPPVRVLRDGRVVEGGYVILKKMLE